MSIAFTPNRFNDKVVIVTGATSGIGWSTAVRAALEGAKVICVGRNSERGNKVVALIKENKGEATFVQADVSKEEDVHTVFETAIKTYGKIDVVINNAGVIMNKLQSILEVTTEEYRRVMSINVDSVFFMTREAAKIFVKQGKGGVIINVGSVAGINGQKNMSAYVTSKHAVTGLTRASAYDLAQYGIRVIDVAPAGVETPMATSGGIDFPAIAAERGCSVQEVVFDLIGQKMQSMQGGMAKPEEQASTILYFASDEAKHITGSIVAADGGYTAF